MLGTIDLGVSRQWRYEFLGHGSTVSPEPGRVFVDVGNRLEPGILDHHHLLDGPESSTEAIASNPQFVLDHLLAPLNRTYYSGGKLEGSELKFQFTTHQAPDWDGVCGYYLVDYLLQNGRLPDDGVTRALVEATNRIDQGLARVEGKPVRPFLLYLMLMNTLRGHEQCLIQGRNLVAQIIETRGRNLTAADFLEPCEPTADFQEVADRLMADQALFEGDKLDSTTLELFLPKRDALSEKVKAFAFSRQPRSVLAKYWVRETLPDQAVLVYPYEKDGQPYRFVISVDPSGAYHLPQLGYELERRETQKRAELGQQRGGSPRYDGYCDNEDPWYDGRGHDFTIVDSPRAGTVLGRAEVLQGMAELYGSPLKMVAKTGPLDAFISYRRNGGADAVWALYARLAGEGKNVFLDVKSMQAGAFDDQIMGSIRSSKNFVLLLSAGALDRCQQADDWVANEIREAIRTKMNIIPVFKPDFVQPASDSLPPEIHQALRFDGVHLRHEYFEEGVRKIVSKMK